MIPERRDKGQVVKPRIWFNVLFPPGKFSYHTEVGCEFFKLCHISFFCPHSWPLPFLVVCQVKCIVLFKTLLRHLSIMCTLALFSHRLLQKQDNFKTRWIWTKCLAKRPLCDQGDQIRLSSPEKFLEWQATSYGFANNDCPLIETQMEAVWHKTSKTVCRVSVYSPQTANVPTVAVDMNIPTMCWNTFISQEYLRFIMYFINQAYSNPFPSFYVSILCVFFHAASKIRFAFSLNTLLGRRLYTKWIWSKFDTANRCSFSTCSHRFYQDHDFFNRP